MADATLLLGPVLFQDFEVPASINFGGGQRAAVHRLIGGSRIIDTLGRDDADIRFAGVLSGSNATLRARTLDELRTTGLPLALTWDVFYYTVVLTRFDSDYRNGWWIPFRVECTVLRDEAATIVDNVASLAQDATGDVSSALTWSGGTVTSLGGLPSAMAAPDATTRGSAAYLAAQADLLSAQNDLSLAIGTAGATVTNAAIDTATSAPTAITQLSLATTAAQQLGSFAIGQGYLSRAAINLAGAST